MKRGTRFLFLLLVAANAQKVVENISNGDLKRQLNQMENEQTFDDYRMKSVMDRILQSIEENKKQMHDMMMMQANFPIRTGLPENVSCMKKAPGSALRISNCAAELSALLFSSDELRVRMHIVIALEKLCICLCERLQANKDCAKRPDLHGTK